MTVEEMKELKQKYGYSYAMISDMSGVPLGTVQKIFSGETANPRYDTLRALEKSFNNKTWLREAEPVYNAGKQDGYTVGDYRELPEERRVELIDGVFYDMTSPSNIHQFIAGEVYRQIANYILDRNGTCRAGIAPFDVQLDCDERTMLQPDVFIVCDASKLTGWGLNGAPDFVLEILSPSTRRKDTTKKLTKYIDAGVREYWIMDPPRKLLLVYFFEGEIYPVIYGLDKPVPVNIYDGRLEIRFDHILKWIEEDEKKNG